MYLILFLTTNAVIYLTIKTATTNFPPQVKFLKNTACGRWKEKYTNKAKKNSKQHAERENTREKIFICGNKTNKCIQTYIIIIIIMFVKG